jgi:hypothetical protein
MNIGDIIKVEEPLKQSLADISQSRQEAEFAFRRAAKWSSSEEKRFWGLIRERYPELNNYDFSYDENRGEILVTRLVPNPA